jgi:hypothetical protein|tara:strand:+ start:1485 stop:1739 length:255 start_codon:yes stop_codon:yes gene_type:complete
VRGYSVFKSTSPHRISFGGDLAGKSVWALASLGKIQPSSCEKAYDYLANGGEACFGYFYSRDHLSARPADIIHCIAIKEFSRKG